MSTSQPREYVTIPKQLHEYWMTVPGGATSSLAKSRYKYAISRALKQHDLTPMYWRMQLKKFQQNMSAKAFVDVLGKFQFAWVQSEERS